MKKNVGANECGNCGALEQKKDGMNVCGRCHRVRYCDRSCQAAHWKGHKKFCIEPKACDPRDQPKEDRAEIECLICLGSGGNMYEHACRARLHPECLGSMYAHAKKMQPPCPVCRAPLPTPDEIINQFMQAKNFEKCYDLLKSFPTNKKVALEVTFFHARYLFDMERDDEAFLKFQEYIQDYEFCGPNDLDRRVEARRNVGYIHRGRKEFALAEIQLRAALKLSPNFFRIHFLLGEILDEQCRDFDMKDEKRLPLLMAAKAVWDRCVELEPTNFNAIFFRGQNRYQLRDLSAALMDGRAAISLSPDFDEAHWLCGRVLTEFKRFPEAQEEINIGIKLSPLRWFGYMMLVDLFNDWAKYERKLGRPIQSLLQQLDENKAMCNKRMLEDPKAPAPL